MSFLVHTYSDPKIQALYDLWHAWTWRDQRSGSVSQFRTGADVFVSMRNMDNILVVADGIEEYGYPKDAQLLRRIWKAIVIGRPEYDVLGSYREGIGKGSWPGQYVSFEALRKRINIVLSEIVKGKPEVWWWTHRKPVRANGPWTSHPVTARRENDESSLVYVEGLAGTLRGKQFAVGVNEVTQYLPGWTERLGSGAKHYMTKAQVKQFQTQRRRRRE